MTSFAVQDMPPRGIRLGSATELGVSDADLAAFYARYWARPIALSRPDFLGWQMREAPAAEGQNHSVVAVSGDEIIAAMGANPAPFVLAGRQLQAAELTTWIVAPQSRGTGVGRKILDHLQARYEVLLGGGISQAALPLYLSAGFAFLAHIPRFFCVTDFSRITGFLTAKPAALRLSASRQEAAEPLVFQARACAAEELADLSLRPGLSYLKRDAARLAWRYDRSPILPYEAFRVSATASGGGAEAGVVLRFDLIAGKLIAHLVDIFGADAAMPAALAFAEAEARRREAVFIDFSGTQGRLGGLIRARGWSSAVDEPLLQLPSLFHPVELRLPPTTSLAVWAREGRAQLYNFADLHVTKADLDFDRPTLAYPAPSSAADPC